MKNDEHLRTEYPDLLGDGVDAATWRIVARLDGELRRSAPQQLAGRIECVAREQAKSATGRGGNPARFLPPRVLKHRTGTLVASLLAMLLLTGAAYAMLPSLQQVFEMNREAGQIVPNGLGDETNISRTADGFTMTVRRAYADSDQIVIGYTLRGPTGRTFNNIQAWGELDDRPGHRIARSPVLTDAQGHEFEGGIATVGNVSEGGEFTNLLVYQRGQLQGGATTVTVHLRVNTLSAIERLSGGDFRDVVVEEPLVFDLTIPVVPAR